MNTEGDGSRVLYKVSQSCRVLGVQRQKEMLAFGSVVVAVKDLVGQRC